ncbi:kinase-like protein [Mytilinidion resinicola]|uniref:EKC/KEOPS complex subunit BUD32 n=1 Tax=Mytilinidion resinicola TaxID=574789 RepID=A0A6A6YXP4_9PEZI|nr:kinase-like protein [Mytilinidion resinicola]KAF2812685.1 kinase-like protein [Mytilinidion resinicola]
MPCCCLSYLMQAFTKRFRLLEEIEDYCLGGFHPVHLGDKLGDKGRYRVIHKLGSGGLATVWLCRDLEAEKYVALKIIIAAQSREDGADLKMMKLGKPGSEELGLPERHFWIEGPNGRHLCLVLPALGPRIDDIWEVFDNPGKTLRSIALQATKGLHFLHSNGLCHGDFRPANILLKISNLDHLSEEEVIQALGKPETTDVHTTLGDDPEPMAPKYTVAPISWHDVDRKYLTDQISIIDFGEAFETATPPKELGTPTAYCSLELLIDNLPSLASDLWALACTISEIRSGRRLFRDWDGDGDVKFQMVQLLGKFPEPWWSSWERRDNWFDDEGNPFIRESGRISVKGPRTIEGYLAEGLHFKVLITGEPKSLTIPSEEVKVLADLLGQLLRYDPKERITTGAVLEHPWFKL